MPAKVRTCLWFDGTAEEAAGFYVSLIPGSRIDGMFRPSEEDTVLLVDFTLGGTPYQALNGGPQFTFNEAASIAVLTADQQETDRLWDALIAHGGSESRCGWLRDRYGLSWQIVPEVLPRLLTDPDRDAAGRAMHALMQMRRIDIEQLETAFHGR